MNVGKGTNAIISLLHHFFATYGLGEKVAHLHVDNCCGQNKNRYMMYYLMWRVLTKQHDEIIISFLPVGHTKFFPNAGFGMLKRKFRRTNVGCLSDIASVVNKSAAMNHAQLVGYQSGNVIVQSHDWANFFEDHVIKAAMKGIKSFPTSGLHLHNQELYTSVSQVMPLPRGRSSFLETCHGSHHLQICPM